MFVSDKFELNQKQVAVLTKAYSTTKVKNIGNNPATLLKSRDGNTWTTLVAITTGQETTITFDVDYMYIVFHENTTLYFQSETPSYYHPSTGTSNGSSGNSVDLSSINQQIASLNQTLSQVVNNINNHTSEIQGITDKVNQQVTDLDNLNSQYVSTNPQSFDEAKQQQARANIGAISQSDLATLTTAVQNGFIKEYATGTIDLNTPATGGTGNGRYWTTTFAKPFSSKPFIILTPSTPNARIHHLSGVKEREFTYSTNYVDSNHTVNWLAFTIDNNYRYNPDSNEIQKQLNLLDSKFNSYVSLDELYEFKDTIVGSATEAGNTLGELENQIKTLQERPSTGGLSEEQSNILKSLPATYNQQELHDIIKYTQYLTSLIKLLHPEIYSPKRIFTTKFTGQVTHSSNLTPVASSAGNDFVFKLNDTNNREAVCTFKLNNFGDNAVCYLLNDIRYGIEKLWVVISDSPTPEKVELIREKTKGHASHWSAPALNACILEYSDDTGYEYIDSIKEEEDYPEVYGTPTIKSTKEANIIEADILFLHRGSIYLRANGWQDYRIVPLNRYFELFYNITSTERYLHIFMQCKTNHTISFNLKEKRIYEDYI